MTNIREQITPELLKKQLDALKKAKGYTEKAANACGISYNGFLNRFRVSGIDFHDARRRLLDGESVENILDKVKTPQSYKMATIDEGVVDIANGVRKIISRELRRIKYAA